LKWIGWLLARLFVVTGAAVVLAVIAIAVLGYSATGNQFLADQIASRVSTPDLQLRFDGARGLLAGNFRLDRVTASDSKGQFATLDDVAIDWSPFDLLGFQFTAERIAAARVEIDRAPVQTIESEPSDGSFSLPVAVDVRQIDLPSITLGKNLAGRSAELSLAGSATGAADLLALRLDARQRNGGAARAMADLAYAVNARTLDLKLDVSEPRGGLLAAMLKLPGDPAIDISVAGQGPLDAWAGKIRAKLDGSERLALDGSHMLDKTGVHQVVLSGGGALSELLPPTLRGLFAGETAIDVDASFSSAGMLDIRSAKLVSGSLSLDIGGSVDPAGQATLNGSLRPVADVVSVQWPLADGMLEADVRKASLTASGPFKSVAFELSTDVARIALPAGSLEDVVLRLGSDRFDLSTRSGLVTAELDAAAATMADPQAAKMLRGPIKLDAPVVLSGDSVKADRIELSSGAIGGTAALAYDLATSAFDIEFKTFTASSALLPPDLAAKAGATIALDGKISGTADNLAFSDIKFTSGLATAKLDGTLANNELTASLSGDIPSLAALDDTMDGRVALTATLSGPLDGLTIDSAVTSGNIVAAGRSLENVDIVFNGKLDPSTPGGSLKAVLALDGQPVNASAEIVRTSGTIALNAINATLGGNTLTGAIDLGADTLPAGRLSARLADLATIGRLVAQPLAGDLDLTLDFKPAGGKLGAVVDGSGTRLAHGDRLLTAPTLHIESTDLIAQTLKGEIKASSLEVGGNRIEDIALSVDRNGPATALSLDGRYDSAPLRFAAELQENPAGLDILVQDLSAAPRGLSLALAEPAFVLIRDGTATIENFRLALGSGTALIRGTAGEALDLRIALQSIPAKLANTFAPDLGAEGVIDAEATVTGKATAPVVAFDVTGKALTARVLVDAGRPPLDVAAKGTFENQRLSANATIVGIDETGDLKLTTAIRLADNGIAFDKFEIASEAVNGTVTGSLQPATQGLNLAFDLKATGKRLLPPDLAARLTAPIALSGTVAGKPDDLTFQNIKLTSNLLTADLGGSLKAGVVDLSLTGALPDLALLQPDADGSATLTATIKGPVAAPTVMAELASPNAVLAGRKIEVLSARLDAVADPKAPKATLTAIGTIEGQTIDVSGDVLSDGGLVRLPALKAVIGRNSLTASLALDNAYLPAGTISFDLPDIGLVAALGGQKAEGDLKGEAKLDNAGGRIAATIIAEGRGLSSEGLVIRAPKIDLVVPDLLTGQLTGTVKADEIASGSNRLAGLEAKFGQDGARTDFSVAARYDDAPLALHGKVLREADAISVTVDSLSAAPRKLPIALSAPATIRIAGGTIDLGTISLNAAGGRLDISGTIADSLAIEADAPDLPVSLANMVSPGLDASGTLAFHATISGTGDRPVAAFTLDGRQLSAAALRDAGRDPLDVKASGRFENGLLTAKSEISGIRELGPASLTGNVALKNGAVSIDKLALRSAPLNVRGDAVLEGDRLAARLSGEIVDLGAFLAQAKGNATFRLEANGPIAALPLTLHLESDNAVMAGKTLERLDIDATATADPAKPVAKITAAGRIDGQVIDARADVVSDEGRITLPGIKVVVGRNTIDGALALGDSRLPTGKLSFDLPDIGLLAALAGQKADGALKGQIDLAETAGKVAVTVKASGEGVSSAGIVVAKPDIDIRIPDLKDARIGGTVRAASVISGTNRLSSLDAAFDNSGDTTNFDVKGNYDGAPLTVAGALQSKPEGLSVRIDKFAASPRKIPVKLSAPVTISTGGDGAKFQGLKIAAGKGSITVDGVAGRNLDLKIKVASLPASLANTFAGGLDASGTIGADATVTGSPEHPQVNFTVNWQNAMTSQIRSAGLSALTVDAKGKLDGTRLSINTRVRGGGGMTLDADGTVETSGSQALNLSVKGKLPFAAIESQLAAQGLVLKGNAEFDLKIGGNAAKPAISGRITTANAQFIAVRQNLVVNKVAATVSLSGQTATIDSLSGSLDGGGKVSATGTIGFAPGSGLPANLAIKLDRAVYADGRVVVAKVSGDLKVTGPLQRGPTLGGTVRLRRADITIPERLPASLANANVTHKHAPADVIRQSKEIRADTSSKADSNKGGGVNLDLRIVAPRQIFVRGRGLDAELGGEVKIAGSSSAPNVSGGFKMLRGRLSIIGKRLDFTTGEITFGGGLVPYLNMIASTTVNATTLNVNVTGLANDPSFTFTSSPALPQDEVLAQLIFGRESSSLSPFQIAQLADAVATLSGGQRNSLFNKLRQGLGVDDLNVGTDENGGAQVTAGKYLNRRTYLELKQGEDETKSGVAINLDIGKGVKLRGEATADGNTSTGVFFEKEY
jgi:translocation and assembly module TamB